MKSIIIGKGINLKPLEESDIEQLREWRNSKEVSNFMLSREEISKEQQGKWFTSLKKNRNAVYWIIETKKGKQLGMVCLSNINFHEFYAEPGLYIGKKEDRSSLFGIEAYFLALDYGFNNLGLKRMIGTVLGSNNAAIKMNNGFGYKSEKVINDHLEVDGFYNTVNKIVLFKDEFYKSKMSLFFKK
jgi:diamine N-acetyltransferase